MHDDSVKINKQEILGLLINTVKAEDRPEFISRLLKGLDDKEVSQDNSIIMKNDIDNSSALIKKIINNIDWETLDNSEYGEDNFFNDEISGLYTSLKNKILNLEDTNDDFKPKVYTDLTDYWNESIAELMSVLATAIDPITTRAYENSGLLIELNESDGKIDTEHLRATLSAEGATAALRIIDIINADAGNSFVKEEDMYIYKTLIEEGVFECDWIEDGEKKTLSIPIENVCFNAAADKFLNTFIAGVKDCKRLELENFFNKTNDYCYRGSIDFNGLPQIFNIVLKITEQIRFKVVSDPWVIPWYNVDGETYSYVRNSDKKVSVLSNDKRLDFTREKGEDKYIRLLMPKYKRKVEVEDLNRNFWVIAQVLTGICINLFDPNGPIQKMLRGLLIEIGQIWENTTYLWAAFDLLNQKRYYDQTHSEVLIISYNSLYPYLKYDNFDNYDLSQQSLETAIENYLSSWCRQYPDYNLLILPCIRGNNYEKNYFSKLTIPGVWVYNRNNEQPEWEIIPFYDETIINNLVIDLQEFNEKIYGIKEQEEIYDYIAPLSSGENLTADEDQRYYGLIRDNIQFEGEVKDNIESIELNIKLYDLGFNLIENYDSIIYNYTATYANGRMNKTAEEEIDDISEEKSGAVDILKGYYQGELLSLPVDIEAIVYEAHIKNIKYVYLNPDDTMPKQTIVDNPIEYKNKYWNNDKEYLRQQLDAEWEEKHYSKKDILFIKGARDYQAGYGLACGFAVRFYINGVKQDYYYPLVSDQLSFGGIHWVATRDPNGEDGSYGTNANTSEYIILRKGTDTKLTSTNWSIMYISCSGGQKTPIFSRDVDNVSYTGAVRALNDMHTVPKEIENTESWAGENAQRWCDYYNLLQPGIRQQVNLQSDSDFTGDISEMYEFLNKNPYDAAEGYYIDGGIFMQQIILAFGPGENQWGSRRYYREDSSQWGKNHLLWKIGETINGSEKGFEDLRRDYVAFMNLDGYGRKYTKGNERNYDQYKDNGREKKQNGDNLTDYQSYIWEGGSWKEQ